MQKLTIILLIVSFTSCLKKLDIESESKDQKLVLNTFLSNQDIIRVHLSESQGQLVDKQLEAIKNADVKLLDGNGNTLENLSFYEDGFNSYYYSVLIPSIGSEYQVTASYPNYESVVGKTSIPSSISNLSFDTTTLPDGSLSIEVSFTDNSSEGDRYVFTVYNYYEYEQYNNNTGQYDTVIQKNETSFESFSPYFEGASSSEGYYYGDVFMKDDLFNGNTISINIKVDSYIQQGIIEIKKVTDEYYNHKFSLKNYWYTEGDPFSEPVRVFSNIENGYGIVAGYNENTFEF